MRTGPNILALKPPYRTTGWIICAAMLLVVLSGGAWAGLTTGVIDTVVGGSNGDGFDASLAKVDPHGLAFNGAGDLLIGDGAGNRVRRIENTTNLISTVAGTGVGG